MTTIRTLLLALSALLLFSSTARASSATIDDRTGFIPAGDCAGIRADAAVAPFDLRILVEPSTSLDALEGDAHELVTGPRVMALAIDSGHHRVVVRFGRETGVKAGDFESIARAGNAHFRAHEIRDGVAAILTRAEASAQAKTALSASSDPVVLERGLSAGTIVAFIFLGACLVGLVVWLWARRQRDRERFEHALEENRLETGELLSRNAEEMAWNDSVTKANGGPIVRNFRRPVTSATAGAYPAQPGIAVNSTYVGAGAPVGGNGSGDLALGLVLGEELADHRNRPTPAAPISTARRHDDDAGGGSSTFDAGAKADDYTSAPPDVDTGGSSSSFDTGSSSSFDTGSSFDSGGSSSSFDSGGGSFDGGGGSSDF